MHENLMESKRMPATKREKNIKLNQRIIPTLAQLEYKIHNDKQQRHLTFTSFSMLLFDTRLPFSPFAIESECILRTLNSEIVCGRFGRCVQRDWALGDSNAIEEAQLEEVAAAAEECSFFLGKYLN